MLQAIPAYIPGLDHPATLDRNVLAAVFGRRSGAARLGDFAITPGGVTRQFNVAGGRAVVMGRENSQQGAYLTWSDGPEILSLPAPVGSPRIDTLLMRIYDDQYGTITGQERAEWEIVQGVPASSPSARPDSDFLTGGSKYAPGAWWRVADFRTNPTDTTIPANQIYPTLDFVRVPGAETLCSSVPSVTGFGGRPTSDAVKYDRIREVDTGFGYLWNGTKWLRDPVKVRAGVTTWTNNTTLSPITGLTIPLEANSTYELDMLIVVFAVQNVGLALSVQMPAGAVLDGFAQGWLDTNGTFVTALVSNASSPVQMSRWGYATTTNHSPVNGRFTITTAGTAGSLTLLGAQGTSSASTSTLSAASWMELRQVG